MSAATKRDARGTVWFGRRRLPVVSTPHGPTSVASCAAPDEQSPRPAPSAPSCPLPQHFTPNPAPREILARSPWEIYEPCAGINYGRTMPFEFTLFEAQVIMRHIPEREVTQILWPVLECLRFLRDQSRELASLTPRDILFTEEGELKIAGIENSRQVDTS
ncbi:hypothetical protein AAWM_07253 [Aspergillus awamori]|uniref:Uncharacterized protein n=1 Tax=Aspergillus awamori TaxID=105351 RepID=A0A401KYI7_ASPAW|nr:hypothetical protein AAWM_07253 [Aspergillus awamori]